MSEILLENVVVCSQCCSSKLNVFCSFQKLVVKPDQLIKRRGKLGLIKVNATYDEVKAWVNERLGKDLKVSELLTVSSVTPASASS